MNQNHQDNPERGRIDNIRIKPHDAPVSAEQMNRMHGREEKGKRTRSSKLFSLGSGLYQAVLYPDPVHAQDKNGEWQEIDNTLVEKQDAEGRMLLENRQNPELQVQLFASQEADMVRLENENGQVLAWTLENAQPVAPVMVPCSCPEHAEDDLRREVLDHLDSEAIYPDILPGVELKCRVQGVSFKDEWKFAQREDAKDIVLLLRAPGMVPQMQEDGEIHLIAQDGEVPFILPKPFMKASGADDSIGAVAVAMEPCADTRDLWRVTYVPDTAWLDQAQFPVVLDPAVITKQHSTAMEDNFVTSVAPNTVQDYSSSALRVSNSSGTYGDSKAFVRFLDSGMPSIDSSYYVTKAYFNISTKTKPTSSASVYLKEVLGSWSANSITYNNRPAVNDKALDYAYMESGHVAGTKYTYDISNLVRKWYSGTNYGLMLESTTGTYMELYSADYAYAKPYATINYVSLAGLESYLAYEEQSAGRAGTGYVSLYNGNLIFAHSDFTANGNLMPVSCTHYYNSCYHDINAFGMGDGWKTNLQQTLHRETLTDITGNVTYYVYMDGDGTRHHLKQTSGTWKDLSGLGLKLTISGTTATLTDKGDNKMEFDLPTVEFANNYANVKMLKSITDACGNVMTLTTNASRHITNAQDGAGRNTGFSYYPQLVTTYPPGFGESGHCDYSYDANGRLSSIWHPDGENLNCTTYYTYNNLGLLETVTNADGLKLTYTYTTAREPYRVGRVEISNGNVKYGGRKYVYGDCMTTVTDLVPTTIASGNTLAEGKSLIYHFNDYGNVVSVNDQLGYACFAKYSDDLPVNHAETASKMQRAVVNLLRNHNMEGTASWTNLNISGTGTYSYATDAYYMGAKSLKMAKTNTTGLMTSYQAVTLTKGKTYTFSSYFKTLTSASAQLRVVYKNSSGVDVTENSLTQQNTAAWDRISLTFTLPANSTSTSATVYLMAADGTGSVWFDSAQLEEGAVANRYNMLLNGDFTYNSGAAPTDWLANSSNTSTDIVYTSCTGTKPEGLSSNTMRMYGTGRTKYAGIYQDIKMTGSAGDVFSAGGWSFNYSMPRKGENFRYDIRVAFLKSGTTSTRENAPSIEWSEEWSDWQFAAGPVVAPCAYTSIRFNVDYERNINYAEFGGLFLHKEEFGKTFAYDANGNVTSTKNLASQQSYATYDSYDNMLTYRQPGRPSTVKYAQTWGDTETEKKKHLLRTSTSPLGIVQAITYDDKGNPLTAQTKNSSGTMVIEGDTTYTTNKNYVATKKDARGKVTTSDINLSLGTLTSITDAKGQSVNYTYDNVKRVKTVQATADSKTYRNAYTYEDDRLKQVAHNTTSDSTCDVAYNFAYDAQGKPTAVKVGTQTLSTNVYNPDGTLQKVVYGNTSAEDPQEIRYYYDEYKRLQAMQSDSYGFDGYTYQYGANGQVAQVKDSFLQRVSNSEYDTANRPMRITHMDGSSHHYTGEVSYDEYNNLKTFKEKVGSGRTAYQTDFTYDIENRPTNLTYGSTSNKVDYTYDALGRISTRKMTAGGSTFTGTYYYKDGDYGNGSTTSLVSEIRIVGGNQTRFLSYEYDDVGNIISAEYNNMYTTYAYDNLGQMVRCNDPWDGSTWTYTYDRGGNILNKKQYSYTTDEDLSNKTVLETILYTYGDNNWKDKLTAYNGTTITYDAIGNPLDDGTWTYQWEKGRQLKSMTKGSLGYSSYMKVEFVYNAQGLRIQKKVTEGANSVVTTTDYNLHGKNIVHIKQGNDNLHYWYDAQGRPTVVEYNGQKYGFIHSLQGDVHQIVDSSGNAVVRYLPDAWGVYYADGTMANTLGKLNPFGYRGYAYDIETGLYYLRSRYYNPTWGRFVNADTVMGTGKLLSHNLFAYCNNNPASRVDEEGFLSTTAQFHTIAVADESSASDPIVEAPIAPIRDVTWEVNTALRPYVYHAQTMNVLSTIMPYLGWARYPIFMSWVNHGAVWDIKLRDSWVDTIGTEYPSGAVMYNGWLMTPEELGNYTYGYLGAAMGLPYFTLIGGSYFAADFPTGGAALENELSDWGFVSLGYEFYFINRIFE